MQSDAFGITAFDKGKYIARRKAYIVPKASRTRIAGISLADRVSDLLLFHLNVSIKLQPWGDVATGFVGLIHR